MSVSRMCSSKSSGTSCRVLPRAMGAFSPVAGEPDTGARRGCAAIYSTNWLTKRDRWGEVEARPTPTASGGPRGHRHRPGRRLARRLHRPSRRPAGTDLRLVRGGGHRAEVQPRARLPRVAAVAGLSPRVRRAVPGDRPAPLRLHRRLGRHADRGRPGLRGDPPRRRRVAAAAPQRAVHVLRRRRGGDAPGHRARRRRRGRGLRGRGRGPGGAGGARGRAGHRSGAGVPRPGEEVPRLCHRRDRPRRPPRGHPGRARAPPALPAAPLRRRSSATSAKPPTGRFRPVTAADADAFVAPRHWEADVLLRDGRTAHIRPIRPDDADLLVDFYSRVSDQSKYYRFFSPMPKLSERDVTRFTHVDHVTRVAFVMLLSERMIALGSYEGHPPAADHQGDPVEVAEVAFLVEDAQQGRGIGQLLLEHLAQAGRERGIDRFVAEVLPDNYRMIQTFRDAGYRVLSGFEDGVVSLEFPIAATDTAIGVMSSREHRAEAASIESFFNPTSVAVIGASRRQDTVGQALVRNLVIGDYTGRVYVVNPTAKAVSGLPAYSTVAEIPGDVDVAVVAVPAEAVQDVVLDCAAKGVRGLIIISSGFAEIGEEGRQRQRRLVGLSRSYGLRVIGPNCLGIVNTDPKVSLNASLSSLKPARGRAGFFCQSGALGSAILEKVNNRGLGLSTFVSAGNRADVSGNDLLQYWEEDESTEVVMMYLESIGNPRKFSRIARRVSLRKPIIAVRSGRTTQGVPMGHSVRKIAAPPQAVDAMFRQAGVIQVDTVDDMFDVAQLAAHQPLPRGRRVAIVGNSDALGLLAADAAAAVGLVVNKQVALSAEPSPEDFEDALDNAIDDPEVDAVVVVYIPPLNVSGEDVANVLAAVGEQSDKPLVSSFLGAEGVPELLRVPDVAGSTAGRGSVPSYSSVESAVRALARVVEYAVWLRTPDGPASDD